MNRFPHYSQVDIEVTVSNPVTHSAHIAPGNHWMLRHEIRKAVHYFGRGLANDDQTHDDRLLSSLIVNELFLAQALHKDQRIARRLAHVLKVIAEAVFGHTGRA
ncbi:hypothetical protein PMI37_01533 [Pseudomonas sp. GM80]|jgi:hypothetical protein|nr:hypothetical protein PMI37_01533 [Pseudomonas sp. GM80]